MDNNQTMTIEAVVCPECFIGMPHAQVIPSQTNRYGTEFRTYLGYCTKCNSGYEVIQFKSTKKDPAIWLIHKYQKYPFNQLGSDGNSLLRPAGILHKFHTCRPSGKWTQLNEMPEPPPVVTGPGGEYDEGFTPETSELLVNLQKAFDAVNCAIECLVRHFQK